MKKIAFIAFVSLAFIACNFTSSTHEEVKKEPTKNNLTISMLIDKKDHSCGMNLQDGQIADTTVYDSNVYGFCSAACKKDFLKNPEAMLQKK